VTSVRPTASSAFLALAGLLAIGPLCSAFQEPAPQTVWDGVYTLEQAKKGEALYSSNCASCHGLGLTGGESAPPLTGGEFLSNWNGLTLGDLFDRIRTTMPADRPGTLTRGQIANILAHMLNVGDFPAGTAELGTRTEILKQVRIEAVKPEARK
jgi:mono/diheme cytochrome c family protein